MTYRMALVTGATAGIGAAFAEALPSTTSLLLTGRRADRLDDAATRLAAPERRVETVAADLASAAGREALIERARQLPIDLLVCNAGLGRSGRFDATPLAAERETVAVNVLATIELIHALLPEMLRRVRRGEGRAGIIIVSSMAAFGPLPGLASYAASKAFALRLGQTLAAELRDEPLDILVLCPSYTSTEFFGRAGLPLPAEAMTPQAVAREGLAALGRRTVHLCGARHQALTWLVTQNPALAVWRWPMKIANRLRHRSVGAEPAAGPQPVQ